MAQEIERTRGCSGELVLRHGPAGLEIVANGVFLVSAANRASSRALVAAAWPRVAGDGLRVLVGGLGIGDALDEALACERVAQVTVVELEPAILRWFHEHGGAPAARAAAAARAGHAAILTGDVADELDRAAAAWDVVALDTDNGPDWLVRDENARLYSQAGLERVARALRPGGAAVFWSADAAPAFAARLATVFATVEVEEVEDVIDGHVITALMYVARGCIPPPAAGDGARPG